MVDGAPINVLDFGAVGDNVADDTAAIQAAVNFLTNGTGGTLYFPAGLYKTTATINVGLITVTNYSFMTARTGKMTDATASANSIPANITANLTKSHVHLEFETGAMIVASWLPANPEPVIAYNLQGDVRTSFGALTNASIVSAVMIQGGVYNPNAVSVPQVNNLIGFYTSRGCRRVHNTFISGIEHGVVSLNGYWTHFTDLYVWRAGGICLNVGQGNAMKIDNMIFWLSIKGLVFDGDASEVRGIHTEQVAEEIIIYYSDTCIFGPAYLEDVDAASGAGTFAVTLGTGIGTQILHTQFEGIRCGAARPGKGAFYIRDCASVAFEGCRAYAKTVTFTSASNGIINQCDFQPPSTSHQRWNTFGSGSGYGSTGTPGSQYAVQGPAMFAVPITLGAIAPGASADHNFTLPAELDYLNQATAHFSYTSGGNPMLSVTTRILFSSPKVVRLTFANPTAAAITPGTFSCSLTVFAAE
jgi:hypothetical protein